MPRRDDRRDAIRFWEKVDRSQTDGCWMWQSRVKERGYGVFFVRRQPYYAHRMAWELTNGAIPDGMWVLHHCDVPGCVRPSHLFIGTPKDNVDDMARKGRRNDTGARHPAVTGAKLTPEQVEGIRRGYRGVWGEMAALAREYSVSPGAIRLALRNVTWKTDRLIAAPLRRP